MAGLTLEQLHEAAVKAAMRYEAATPGTLTKGILERRWERAEEAFTRRLNEALAGRR